MSSQLEIFCEPVENGIQISPFWHEASLERHSVAFWHRSSLNLQMWRMYHRKVCTLKTWLLDQITTKSLTEDAKQTAIHAKTMQHCRLIPSACDREIRLAPCIATLMNVTCISALQDVPNHVISLGINRGIPGRTWTWQTANVEKGSIRILITYMVIPLEDFCLLSEYIVQSFKLGDVYDQRYVARSPLKRRQRKDYKQESSLSNVPPYNFPTPSQR